MDGTPIPLDREIAPSCVVVAAAVAELVSTSAVDYVSAADGEYAAIRARLFMYGAEWRAIVALSAMSLGTTWEMARLQLLSITAAYQESS